MKRLLIFFMILILGRNLHSQEQSQETPLSVGYLSHIGFQPGIKLGTRFELQEWNSTNKKDVTVGLQMVLRPQLGFFTNPGDDSNWLLGVEGGLLRHVEGRNRQSSLALGVNLLQKSKLVSFSVNLGSGDKGDREREGTSYFLPTLSYRYDWGLQRKANWYFQLASGPALGNDDRSLMLFFEFGKQLHFTKKIK